MRWKDLVVEYLRRKQGGRCRDCGLGIKQNYQKRVEYIAEPATPFEEVDIDLLKLVHENCESTAIKPADLKAIQAHFLLRRGIHPAKVAETLDVSERTVYRYNRAGKRLHNYKKGKSNG